MLACRLCLHFGIDDPEQWLENCGQRKLNVWRAFAEIDGLESTDRYLLAQSTVTLKRLLMLKYQQEDRESVLKSVDKTAACFLPADKELPEEQPEPMDPGMLVAMARTQAELKTQSYSIEVDMVDPWQQP